MSLSISVNLPLHTLLTIYKSFIRTHLVYGDILYNKQNTFRNKREKMYD